MRVPTEFSPFVPPLALEAFVSHLATRTAFLGNGTRTGHSHIICPTHRSVSLLHGEEVSSEDILCQNGLKSKHYIFVISRILKLSLDRE